uniref:Uncharacterized protein n=1 Tax=Romanomermis culicivorax TaxID=13658 RepID=A0A915I6M9_ROMCU
LPHSEKKRQHITYDVYVSYNHEEGYICPATIKNNYQNDTVYDVATINERNFNLNNTLHINIISKSAEPKQIAISMDKSSIQTYGDNSQINVIALKLWEQIPFHSV